MVFCCLQVKLCDPCLSALEVSRLGASTTLPLPLKSLSHSLQRKRIALISASIHSGLRPAALGHVGGRPHLSPRVLPFTSVTTFVDPERMKGWVGLVDWSRTVINRVVSCPAVSRAQDTESVLANLAAPCNALRFTCTIVNVNNAIGATMSSFALFVLLIN